MLINWPTYVFPDLNSVVGTCVFNYENDLNCVKLTKTESMLGVKVRG